MTFTWTAARIEKLTELWTAGYTASVVAKQLGNGLSRCAVIGKTRRLKLPRRDGEHRGVRAMPNPPKVVYVPAPAPKPSGEEPASLRIPFAQAKARECRWISSDPIIDSSICGHATLPNKSLCAYHHSRAFQPATHIRRESDAQ